MGEYKLKELALNGKLITSVDPVAVGENFVTLKNMRYSQAYPVGIGGMSKVNTTALTTYLKIRNGHHFRKEQPAESHVLVQAYNTGLTASQVLQNTTAIDSQGDFSGTALHTDGTDAVTGRFADTPGGGVVYCNGVETMFWGGDEYRCSKFINYDPDGSYSYDYTNQINNTLTTALNIATLHNVSGGDDANTMLLLHLDNNVTDTSDATVQHTVTNNNVTFTITAVFGSHSADFNGTNAYLTVPDHADFDFSGGTFTIDGRFRVGTLASIGSLFYQQTDANNYISLYVDTNGAIQFEIYAASASVVALATPNSTISINTWYHIELVENGDDWFIFIDGVLKAYTSDVSRAANFTGLVQVGYDGTDYYTGQIDEFRVSNSARHTSEFEVPSVAYDDTSAITYIYVGGILPIQGFNITIATANTATSTMSVDYWDGSDWTAVSSLSDGTASGGISLAQTGSVTFTSTETTSNVRTIEGVVLHWYRVRISAADTTTTISQVTLDIPFQDIQDLWDGEYLSVLSFQTYDNSTYNDFTTNVYEEDYSSANTATYAELDSLATGTDYVVAGFAERQMGLNVVLVGGAVNTTASTVLSLYYWNGTGWTTVGSVTDGTIEDSKSFAKSGTITWNPPTEVQEFKTAIAKELPLYYYKLEWDQTLSGDVKVDYVSGIAAQKNITGYAFPLFAQDRIWLCDNKSDRRNAAICTAKDTDNVFNGEDTIELTFGDSSALTAGASLYSQFGSNLYNVTVFCKKNSTWVVVGNSPEDWIKYPASHVIGCIAPLTMRVAHIDASVAQGINNHIAIMQGATGIYLFDGKSFFPIHADIENYFDQKNSDAINQSKIADSVGFFDKNYTEYHWLFASGTSTTLNKELVYDISMQKWYEIDRTKYLQAAIECEDTDGNNFIYGAIDTGYLEQLESGTDFDGTAIGYEFQFGDIAIQEGSIMVETTVRHVKLVQKAKTVTSNSVTCTHYGDTSTTGTDITISPTVSGKRVADVTKCHKLGSHIFHSFKYTLSTDDETKGFEPVYAAFTYKPIRIDRR